MARLLPLLIVLVVGIVLLLARLDARRGRTDGRTYRPRWRSRKGSSARGRDGGQAPVVMRRTELAGLRDAYSGAPLDAARPLVRCAGCFAIYHTESAAVLARENGGRCAACGDTRFDAVRVT
jgi:hypothetical protein